MNSLAVIALIRQVGLLHVRIKPVPALTGEGGPLPGTEVSFADELRQIVDGTADRVLIGVFTPTCGLCGPLMPAFRGLGRTLPAQEIVVLATDADRDRAIEYLQQRKVNLPLITSPTLLSANQIPGAPFIIVTDSDGKAITSGVVNTLENIESLLEAARNGGVAASGVEEEVMVTTI